MYSFALPRRKVHKLKLHSLFFLEKLARYAIILEEYYLTTCNHKKGKLMKATSRNLFMALITLFALSLTGCASQSEKADGAASDSVVSEDDSSPLELNGSSDDNTAGGLNTIYFDFDSSRLTTSARTTLEQNAEFMKTNQNVDIQIEGHADERGGEQYNLALGERRARSVKDYLVALGLDANRISVISFGKTTPKAFGHSEDAWSQNRRANFVITAK